ncbi:MAG: DoxX family protein [Longimicrobiales bacterium]
MSTSTSNSRRAAVGIAVLRVVVGIVFFMHGWMKLFVMGIDGVTGFFSQLGIPFPHIAAPFVSALELGGGALLILGVLSRGIAALLAFDMFVAIVVARIRGGFFVPDGYELELTLMAACVALALAGPGAFSLDRKLFRWRDRTP